MQKTITKTLILMAVLTVALGTSYLFAAWTGPTQTPPDGNTDAPVHIGTTDQVKDGGLSLDALSGFGGGYFQGDVGIGTMISGEGANLVINSDDDEIKLLSNGNVIMGNERYLHGKTTSDLAHVLIGMSEDDKVTIAYDGEDTIIGERGGTLESPMGKSFYYEKNGSVDITFPVGISSGILYITQVGGGNTKIATAMFGFNHSAYIASPSYTINTIFNSGIGHNSNAFVGVPTWSNPTLTIPLGGWSGGTFSTNIVRYQKLFGDDPIFN